MIIKKTYVDSTYAIFELLDINSEFHTLWLTGFVIESNVENITPKKLWDFEASATSKFEVIEV